MAIFVYCMFSCSKIFTDDIISIQRKINSSNRLKLDGYFYQEKNDVRICYFLYENGILINDNYEIVSFKDREELYIDSSYIVKLKNDKTSWGVYEVENDVIKFDRWYPSEKPYRAVIREGIIINDSIFVITKSYKANGTDLSSKNEIYKFRAFSPKPDSTNRFIK